MLNRLYIKQMTVGGADAPRRRAWARKNQKNRDRTIEHDEAMLVGRDQPTSCIGLGTPLFGEKRIHFFHSDPNFRI